MNTYRPAPANNFWVTAAKIVVLILGLYVAAVVLGRVFSWLLIILFSLVKVVVFVVVAFAVLHFLVKLLFGYNLFRSIFGSRFGRH